MKELAVEYRISFGGFMANEAMVISLLMLYHLFVVRCSCLEIVTNELWFENVEPIAFGRWMIQFLIRYFE